MTTTNSTTTPNTAEVAVRLDFDRHAAGFSKAMGNLDQAATKELDKVYFDHRLRELVRIRASQLNGCAYCIDMHIKDAPSESYDALAAQRLECDRGQHPGLDSGLV